MEKRRLQNQIVVVAESEFRRDGDRVDGVEFHLFGGELTFDCRRNKFFQTVGIQRGVEQQSSALLQLSGDVVLADVGFVVAADEVSVLDVVGGTDGTVTETQVRLGHTEGLFGVILKVSLRELGGMGVDDLDRTLVRTDSSIGTQSPELAAYLTGVIGIDDSGGRQREVGDIIFDTDGEIAAG